MSDNQKVISIFDQYNKTRPKTADQATPDTLPAASTRSYRAYGIDAPQRRPSMLAIHYGNGAQSLLPKSYVQEIYMSSSQYVSLICSSCIITLEGEYLDQLVELLQDEKILSLHCFNPKLHDTPPEGEMIIHAITRRSARDLSALSAHEKKKELAG